MTRTDALLPPPHIFIAGSAVALAGILFVSILTIWVAQRWSIRFFEAAIFALATAWSVRMIFFPFSLQRSLVLALLAGAPLIGLLQLVTGSTVNRWETWNAVLKWTAYLVSAFLVLQICSTSRIRELFLRSLLYFGAALSVVSVLQLFTSRGKLFWLFESGYTESVLGPFINPDHYAAFIELLLPLALFNAFAREEVVLSYTGIAAGMFASVIAGASRAGSVLVILESATILLLMSRRRTSSARKPSTVLISFLVLALVFTAVVGWTHLWQRFQDPDPYLGRREMLFSTMAMIRDKPLNGFGLGNFANVYPAYAYFDTGSIVTHAHNDWAEWAAEGGLPFFALVLTAVIGTVPYAIRSPWGLGIIFVFLHSLVDFPMQQAPLALWVFVLLGAVLVRQKAR
jgi:O-antigen ligase